MDLWEDVGPFLYQNMPENDLSAFFTEERDMLRISHDMNKWWVAEDGRAGEDPHETLAQAKADGDARLAAAFEQQEAVLMAEAGLDPASWALDLTNGISFRETGGSRSIIGDTHQPVALRQSWSAWIGDDMLAAGMTSVADALRAFDESLVDA